MELQICFRIFFRAISLLIIEYSEICIMTVDLLEKCVRRVGSLAGHTFYECLHAGAVKIVSDK